MIPQLSFRHPFKIFYRVWQGVSWIIKVAMGLLRFAARNPSLAPVVFKAVVTEWPRLPYWLRRRIRINEERTRMKKRLGRCSALFEFVQSHYQVIDLNTLKQNETLYGEGWDAGWIAIYILLRALKPAVVVETGVEAGGSSSYILQALADNEQGYLYSIDLPSRLYELGKGHPEFTPLGEQPGYLIPTELRQRWKLLLGNSRHVLPELLEELGEIDFFLHDSEHTYETMTFEYECAWPCLRPSGYLASDDVLLNTAFSDFAQRQGLEPTTVHGKGFIQKTAALVGK